MNQKDTAARNDGGGNHSSRGMKTNSILFTIMMIDWIDNQSFFDHLVRVSSGGG